jgi:hypothetical protein
MTVNAAKDLPAWDRVYTVFRISRWAECDVADERPRWSGAPHGSERVLPREVMFPQLF